MGRASSSQLVHCYWTAFRVSRILPTDTSNVSLKFGLDIQSLAKFSVRKPKNLICSYCVLFLFLSRIHGDSCCLFTHLSLIASLVRLRLSLFDSDKVYSTQTEKMSYHGSKHCQWFTGTTISLWTGKIVTMITHDRRRACGCHFKNLSSGSLIRLLQCQWRNHEGHDQYQTTVEHQKAWSLCAVLGIYCIWCGCRIGAESSIAGY